MSKSTVEQLVEEIRDWECEAGEGYCDYFFDRYSYDGRWLQFLTEKGFLATVEEIKEDVYVCLDGTRLVCTDQQLKFEPHITWHCDQGGKWDEEVYCKDVALWAEFLLKHDDIYENHKEFLKAYTPTTKTHDSHKETNMTQPSDQEFLAIAQEMLMCFNEGRVDYHTNFDSPYDYGSMRYAAWSAGYAKALEQDDTQC